MAKKTALFALVLAVAAIAASAQVDIKLLFPEARELDLSEVKAGLPVTDGDGLFVGMIAHDKSAIAGFLKAVPDNLGGAFDPKAGAEMLDSAEAAAEVRKVMPANASFLPALRFETRAFMKSGMASPYGVDPADLRSSTKPSLLLIGPCFPRAGGAKDRGLIFVACPAAGKELQDAWIQVPVSAKRERHELGGGFVTGKAGFLTREGQDFFYVEFYAWPADPYVIGG